VYEVERIAFRPEVGKLYYNAFAEYRSEKILRLQNDRVHHFPK
jgi:hypothetical protein